MTHAVRFRIAALAVASLGLIAALGLGGCLSRGSALCGAAPTSPIVGFVVTTTTGSDGTDANIHFCYTRKSASAESCHNLDKLFADDFEPHEVNTFEWTLTEPIAAGDLSRFVIKNQGGGFLNNGWEMQALRVQAVLGSGDRVLLYEEEMFEDMDSGDSYDSSQCVY